MTYLKEFATQAEYDAFVESGEMVKPNVSLVNEPFGVFYNKFASAEPEVITYAFEVPMTEGEDAMFGRVKGDFSNLHGRLTTFLEKNGDPSDDYDVRGEVLEQNVSITINGHNVISMCMFDNVVMLYTDGPESFVTDTMASLSPESIYYMCGKEEPSTGDMVEYHFEVPMREIAGQFGDPMMSGGISGDFSSEFDGILAWLKKNGSSNESGWWTEGELDTLSITINGYSVTSINTNGEESMDMETNAPKDVSTDAYATLSRDYMSFEHAIQ